MDSQLITTDGLPQNRKLTREEKRFRNRCTSIQSGTDEIEFKRFEENRNVQHPDEYKRTGTDPSLLIIFNQKSFTNDDVRLGSNRDVNELILTFGRLGHNVEQEFIYNDLTKEKILSTISKLSKKDFTNRNSLIVVFLTHGGKNNVVYAQDDEIFLHEIWEPFCDSKCLSFKNKPKFFIFQSCKGDRFSKVHEIDVDVFPESTFTSPIENDMLIAFATVEGSVANRHIYNGTWFIQELCRNINSYGRRDDVLSILIGTAKCIGNNYYHITDEAELVKQIPLFISTLTKKFYLTTSKDRCLLIEMINRQEALIQSVQSICD